LAVLVVDEVAEMGRWLGAGLEQLRRRLRAKDGWIFDEDQFTDAVEAVRRELVDAILVAPYDGSMMADRAISGFTSRWIEHLIGSVRLIREPTVRAAYVALSAQGWHRVSVLKFVHSYFILDRPDLAMFQRGQAETLNALVTGFDAWLSDRTDAARAPRRLIDLVATATDGYRRIAEEHPEWLDGIVSETALARMSRGRGIVDFVSALTDEQAVAFAARLTSAGDVLWTSGPL
jgi:dGTPase